MRGVPLRWSAEELAWLAARADRPRRRLHAAFVARFGRDDVAYQAFGNMLKRRRWLTGRSGRFAPGHGVRGGGNPQHPNCVATRFKPGVLKGRANKMYRPIGSTRPSACGAYIEVKVHDGQPLQSRWRGVHLVRWEAIHGPLPAGHCLKCLDGDSRNTDPDNWVCIPRAMLPRLNGRFGRDYDRAPADLKPLIMQIARLEHAARERRRARAEAQPEDRP